MVAAAQPFVNSGMSELTTAPALVGGGSQASGARTPKSCSSKDSNSNSTSTGMSDAKDGKRAKKRKEIDPFEEPYVESVLQICDPATKQKIAVPFVATDRTAGRLLYYKNLSNPARRESHVCMLYQKGKCRSNVRCNQIHVERAQVTKLRNQFYELHGKERSDEPVSKEPDIIVRDPSNMTSLLTIPFSKTDDTAGRQNFMSCIRQGVKSENSLCHNYIYTGTCHQAKACVSIHADREFVKYLQQGGEPCCPAHGPAPTPLQPTDHVYMVNKAAHKCFVPYNKLSASKGLTETAKLCTPITFGFSKVCKLHQERRCPYGTSCGNIHVCREFVTMYTTTPTPGTDISHIDHVPIPLPLTVPVPVPVPIAVTPMPIISNTPAPTQTTGPVTGTPLNAVEPQRELFGIPLSTQEGPLPTHLLPPSLPHVPSPHHCVSCGALQPLHAQSGAGGGSSTGGAQAPPPLPNPASQVATHPPAGGTAPPGTSTIPYADSEPSQTPPSSPAAHHLATTSNATATALPALPKTVSSTNNPYSMGPYASGMSAAAAMAAGAGRPPAHQQQMPPIHTMHYHPPGALPHTWSEVMATHSTPEQSNPSYFGRHHATEFVNPPSDQLQPHDSFIDPTQAVLGVRSPINLPAGTPFPHQHHHQQQQQQQAQTQQPQHGGA